MKKKLLIIKKFGGTSLSTVKKIGKAAQIIKKEINKGNKLVVIVSALGKTTDKLQSIINKIYPLEIRNREILSPAFILIRVTSLPLFFLLVLHNCSYNSKHISVLLFAFLFNV